ncbi:MAG: hypothetical protein JZU63_10240 [Rhodoferax sp.]|nr:hypothetical protein [Rhodoferax sp.]
MKAAPFKAKDISDIIMAAKLPKPGHCHTAAEVAMRGAGNIIQAQRKKGFLRQAKPFPTWQWGHDNT